MLSRYPLASFLIATVPPNDSAFEVLNPENGHYYRLTPTGAPWVNSKLFASQEIKDGQRGHLVTITSASEQQFIEDNFLFGGGSTWTGGIQPAGSPEPAGNWQWVTGEAFTYANWYPGGFEPNNIGDEFVIELFNDSGYWNDTHLGGSTSPPFQKGWVVEFTPGYVPSLVGADFLNWQRGFNRSGTLLGDFSGDRTVNAADLTLWKSYFGGGAQSPTLVPEASGVLLVILGALGMGTVCRSMR